MKRLALAFCLCLASASNAQPIASEDAEIAELFAQVDALQGQSGDDDSSMRRLLQAILERDPDNPKAQWKLLFIDFPSFGTGREPLLDSAEHLVQFGEPIKAIVAEAERRGDLELAHFIKARYAAQYRNFDRALAELDEVLRINPNSQANWVYKGKFLAEKGKWVDDDAPLLAGLAILEEQMHRAEQHPDPKFPMKQDDFYFELAWYNDNLIQERPEKTIEYYQAAIQHNQGDKTQVAYAWHNMGNTYRKMQRCAEARDATQKALAIMRFPAAEDSLQHSEFCLEMQALEKGLAGEAGK